MGVVIVQIVKISDRRLYALKNTSVFKFSAPLRYNQDHLFP
jgi:hypothetical protein